MNFLAYFLLSIGILMGIYSCQSQKDRFDLTKDVLGKHIDSILIQKKIKTSKMASAFMHSYDIIMTASKEMLTFNKENFEGYEHEETYYKKNKVVFHFPKKDSVISSYRLSIYQTENTEKLIANLDYLLKKPNFVFFRTLELKEKKQFETKIWVDEDNNISYLLRIKAKKNGIKESFLYAVDNKDTLYLNWVATSPGFYFWGDYLEYKERFKKTTTFSYKDFVEESLENGSEQYAKLSEWE